MLYSFIYFHIYIGIFLDIVILERFLRACKQPIVEGDVMSSDRIVRKVYRKKEVNIEYQVDALILPEDLIWPTFIETKQRHQDFKNIYFQRQTIVDANRRTYSLDLLRKKETVIWTGAAGIGKSCDINHILIELLSHLGEDSWPSMVAYRIENDLFSFTSSGVTSTRISYADLHEYSKIHQRDNSVLILELQESETDPVIRRPFILAVSARNLSQKLKTVRKSGGREYMLISPPEVEEVCLMAEAIMDIYPDNDIFKGMSKEEAISTVQTRALQIGAIPRYLFCKSFRFESRLNELIASESKELTTELDQLSVDNIPKLAQLLMAPYLRPGVTNPIISQRYEKAASEYLNSLPAEDRNERMAMSSTFSTFSHVFRYLSDFAKQIHYFSLRSSLDVARVKRLGYDYQLAEEIISLGILIPKPSERVDDRITSDNWEWHGNVNYNQKLSRNSKLPNEMIPMFPRSSAQIKFGGMYYIGDVSELKGDCLYRGKDHNLALYEFFNVDHVKKIIYLYQVTTIDLSKHPFYLSTISRVMEKLSMFEERNLEYKVRLLCFCDWSREDTHGTKFFDMDGNIVTLDERRALNDRVAVRLEVYIIRACLFLTETKFELP